MSWLFGVVGNIKDSDISKISTVHSNAAFVKKSQFYYIAASGINELILSGKVQYESQAFDFCINGMPHKSNSDGRILSEQDLQNILSNDFNKLYNLEGHFAGAIFNEKKVLLFNDKLGIKEIYFATYKEKVFFSTRIDYVAKFIPKAKLDLKAISSRWLLCNPISDQSIVKNITRLTSSSYVEIYPLDEHPDKLRISVISKSIIFDTSDKIGQEDFLDVYRKSLKKDLFPDYEKVIMLSGGIDSRFTYVNHLTSEKKAASVTIGIKSHPDVKIAKKVAAILGQIHIHIYETDLNPQKYLESINDFSALTQLIEPISEVHRKIFYRFLYNNFQVSIDSATGEFLRNGYYSRFYLDAASAFQTKNEGILADTMKQKRADIFTSEVTEVLENSIRPQIAEVFRNMPNYEDYGYSNWVNLFAFKTRIRNIQTADQNRADHFGINYKAILQPSVIEAIFKLRDNQRNDSKMIKDFITNYNKKLSKLPIIREAVYLPFNLSDSYKFILKSIKEKFGYSYKTPRSNSFLHAINDFTLDTLSTNEFNNSEYYDKNKVSKIIENFKGNKQNDSEMDWLLSFEIFRKIIEDDKILL